MSDIEARVGVEPLAHLPRTGRRIREDFPDYELRGAKVRVARKAYACDLPECYNRFLWAEYENADGLNIRKGYKYALISTGIRICSGHFTPDDVVSVHSSEPR